MLYREPKLLKGRARACSARDWEVSVLYREPKLLKVTSFPRPVAQNDVSVLYREPKLLKVGSSQGTITIWPSGRFSALP